ncbi:hypothetical protein AB205_0003610 [Aquarana catesbeiana]|uniref:Uncharacterized protein n=1 Tax=Aquarana catesbeiana TaxID=8400 RepID=A0A2G9S4T6_AQUCT|nr:hypothetical protein AB205_0003610 [Aquarana catesbeiana]
MLCYCILTLGPLCCQNTPISSAAGCLQAPIRARFSIRTVQQKPALMIYPAGMATHRSNFGWPLLHLTHFDLCVPSFYSCFYTGLSILMCALKAQDNQMQN